MALLALLAFGLAGAVALARMAIQKPFGMADDPKHWMTRLQKAQVNTAESVALLAALMLVLAHGGGPKSPWLCVLFLAATAGRFLHSGALVLYRTLGRFNVYRTTGATTWLVAGAGMALALIGRSL